MCEKEKRKRERGTKKRVREREKEIVRESDLERERDWRRDSDKKQNSIKKKYNPWNETSYLKSVYVYVSIPAIQSNKDIRNTQSNHIFTQSYFTQVTELRAAVASWSTYTLSNTEFKWGGGDSSVVRAPDSWLKGRGFESLLERRENFLLQGRLSVLTLISVSVPPPCYRSST